ncbi:MAG: hypothetical protein LWW81_08045 [Rhodocyclales bacterium]|nr:hypothetical protein [Rhodocyclales bacterium]
MNARMEHILNTDPAWFIQTTPSTWTPPVGLAKLCHWPDLNEIPDEMIIIVARILALLGSKPTASHLINRLLGSERHETFRALQVLESLGHIEFISVASPTASTADGIVNDDVLPEPTKASGLSAFIGKLRLKLLG